MTLGPGDDVWPPAAGRRVAVPHERQIAAYPAYVPSSPPPLDFDPIDRAGELWERNWPGEDADVYASMRAVTSIMRAQQILIAELDALLRPYGVTFSRYEALVLLSYSREGSLPLSKIGERLQVHATSVTNVIDRLEAAGLVRREPNPRDGRGTLAVITSTGRDVVVKATAELNAARFGLGALDTPDLARMFDLLRRLRVDAGDFTA
jgi:DNA-binding MarR family transcriptional regulator